MGEKEVQKQIHRAKLQNKIILIVFIALTIAVILGVCVYKYQRTFSIEKWNTDKYNRTKIVGDLLEDYNLIGMRETDIIELLGEEDSEQSSFKTSRKEYPSDTTLVYFLGVDYMDNEWLILSLEDGIVYEYCIDVS